MNNVILILILFSGISFANAQEFENTDAYQVSISPIVNDKEQTLFNATLVIATHPETVVTNFKIMSPDRVKTISIQSLKHPKLLDVDEIIKMELTYCEPQVYTISKYILVKKNQTFVDLPAIVNMIENTPNFEALYIFPNQAFGQTNKIIKVEITYSDSVTVENIDIKKAFAWNDNFDGSQKISGL